MKVSLKNYTSMIKIKKIEEFPEEIKEYLLNEGGLAQEELDEMLDGMSGLKGWIQDCGKSKESLDTHYVITVYSWKAGKYTFIAEGSQYRKDGGLCEFEFDEAVEILDNEPKPQPINIKKLFKIKADATDKIFKAFGIKHGLFPVYSQLECRWHMTSPNEIVYIDKEAQYSFEYVNPSGTYENLEIFYVQENGDTFYAVFNKDLQVEDEEDLDDQ